MTKRIDSIYSIQILTKSGNLIGEFSGRAENRSIKLARNRAEEIIWRVGLIEFQEYANTIGISIKSLIGVNENEVRIKRGDVFICGGQIRHAEVIIEGDDLYIEIRALGFLELFADRYTDILKEFSGIDQGMIAWTLVDESQDLTNGDFGITLGNIETTVNRDRTFEYKNIKDAIIELSEVEGGFDFEFTYNKKFYIYESLGVTRSSLLFQFPGNIKRVALPMNGLEMVNEAIMRGSGFGSGQIIAIRSESVLQPKYKLRQKIYDYPSVVNAITLNEIGDELIDTFKKPLEIPQITLDGNQPPYIGAYKVGDRIPLKFDGVDALKHLNDDTYRIDAISVTIDNNDSEEIILTLSP